MITIEREKIRERCATLSVSTTVAKNKDAPLGVSSVFREKFS
ncbi:hypothetical protein ACNKHL_24515 [Shigella flexneri]